MFRLPRGGFAWAVPLLLVLAVLLVAALAFNLANLDTGGETFPQAPAQGEPAARVGVLFPDPIATTILTILVVFFLVGSVVLLFQARGRTNRPARTFTWWQVLARALGMALLVAVLVGWPRAIQAARERAGTDADTTAADAGTFTTVWPAATGWPIEFVLIVAVFVAVVWLMVLLRRGMRPAPDWDAVLPVSDARDSAAVAVRTAIREIEEGGEIRGAILACFQRFCGLLGMRGITDQEALTPRELEALAVARWRVSRDASGVLTSLFEEARYSQHPLGDADRVRAIDSLGRIQAALEA